MRTSKWFVKASNFRRHSKDPRYLKSIYLKYFYRKPFPITDHYGLTMEIDPKVLPLHDLKEAISLRSHFDDEGLLKLLEARIEPGMTIFDVGASFGQFSLSVAPLLREEGQIHLFEPVSYSMWRLRRNLCFHKDRGLKLFVNQVAIGDRKTKQELYLFPQQHSTWNSLSKYQVNDGNEAIEPIGSELVTVISLDQYCNDNGITQINILKIDVEGHEYEVLKGCRSLLERQNIDAIIFEISLLPLRAVGYEPDTVITFLIDYGFKVHMIAANGTLEEVNMQDFKFPNFANYLAVPSV